jgi:hypothetical protein
VIYEEIYRETYGERGILFGWDESFQGTCLE